MGLDVQQITGLFALGSGISMIVGGFLGVKVGLNGTKKTIEEIKVDLTEIKTDNKKYYAEIIGIKQHCVDTHGVEFQK